MERINKWIIAGRPLLMFVLLGNLCIFIPDKIVRILPLTAGILLILYGVFFFGAYLVTKYEGIHVGKSLIFIFLGIALCTLDQDSIGLIGCIWALISLYEAAESLDLVVAGKKHNWFQLCSTLIAIVLALVLLCDPNGRLLMHIRILGGEMIITAFVKAYSIDKGIR